MEAPSQKSFFAARWEHACARTKGRFAMNFKAFLSGCFALFISLIIGWYIYGIGYIFDEAQPSVSALITLIIILALSMLPLSFTIIWDYLRSPALMWKEGQAKIATMSEMLRPNIVVGFELPYCYHVINKGNIVYAEDRTKWYKWENAEIHMLFAVKNNSHRIAKNIVATVVAITWTDDEGIKDVSFICPVKVFWINATRDYELEELATDAVAFVSIFHLTSVYTCPALSANEQLYHYHYIFREKGRFVLNINFSTNGITFEKIKLSFDVNYDIVKESQKTGTVFQTPETRRFRIENVDVISLKT